MIKFFGYGKLFIILLISSFVLFLNLFVSALDLIPIGQSSTLNGGNDCYFDSNLGIHCGLTQHVLSSFDPQYSNSFVNVFWSNDGIGVYYNQSGGTVSQGLVSDGFYICSGNYYLISGYSSLNIDSCNPGFTKVSVGVYSNLIDKLKSSTPLYWVNFNYFGIGNAIIIVYQDFYFSFIVDGYSFVIGNGNYIFKNMGFQGSNFLTFSYNNNYVLSSLLGGNSDGLGNGGIELESNESALNYYESRYGRNENICYVGIDSLTYLYGQNGVSFQEGEGLSIFDVYSDLYGSGYDLKWVGNWLNTWLLNYEQWFNSRGINSEGVGHPSWLSYYNSGIHLGDLYYDNLTFPFANQPVAFYFMATYIDQNAPYSTMGSPVVSYCNIKINSGSFDEIIDQSDKNNITNYTEQSNINIGLNSDGTDRDYGYWLGSGVDVAFSGNVTIKNTLKNFFDQFFDIFKIDVNPTRSNPILPGRLATCLLFVVLFKFIRRR